MNMYMHTDFGEFRCHPGDLCTPILGDLDTILGTYDTTLVT